MILVITFALIAFYQFFLNEQQKVIAERMEINPFGLRFGHADIAFVSGNSAGETTPNNAFDFHLPFSFQ